jgi:hypothetical protein
MTDTQLLVGSLSNDLFRVATLVQRGSMKAATRFAVEAKRWAEPLSKTQAKGYIIKIAEDINNTEVNELTIDQAEKYLMYGILLQNYALHTK